MKSLEKAANISIIIAVVTFLAILIRNEVTNKQSQPITGQTLSSAIENKPINIPGIRFPRDHQVLLMALSTTCHFCKESSPFYRGLIDKQRNKVEIITAFPQSRDAINSYMKEENLASSQVLSTPLDQIGVLATPTLLLVDKSGVVRKIWVGYLDGDKQTEVDRWMTRQ
jgi:hypothetical protein